MDNEKKAKPKGLAAKMAAAMAEVGRVPKRGVNQAQGYNYARADDVAEGTREALSRQGIAVYPDVKDYGVREIQGRNGVLRVTWAKVAWTFRDTESDESVTINVPGEGQDSGDKGLYKAITGSMKYALMATFLIPTGEGDPEHEEPGEEEEKPAPRAPGARQGPSGPPPEEPSGFREAAAGEAGDAMRQALANLRGAGVTGKGPATNRKGAVMEYLVKRFGDNSYRAAIARVLGRTFPDREEIMINMTELEKLEAFVIAEEIRDTEKKA